MTRLDDWEQRLHDLVAARLTTPFTWGANDCALWGADVVMALTGVDHGAAFRGQYADARGAAEALRLHGAGTIVKTFDSHLSRCAPALARRGDLVRARGSIGVIYDADALFVGQDGAAQGLVRISRTEWSLAWRV